MIPWAPIIGAGASLLGSIFGGHDNKQATQTIETKWHPMDPMFKFFHDEAMRRLAGGGTTRVNDLQQQIVGLKARRDELMAERTTAQNTMDEGGFSQYPDDSYYQKAISDIDGKIASLTADLDREIKNVGNEEEPGYLGMKEKAFLSKEAATKEANKALEQVGGGLLSDTLRTAGTFKGDIARTPKFNVSIGGGQGMPFVSGRNKMDYKIAKDMFNVHSGVDERKYKLASDAIMRNLATAEQYPQYGEKIYALESALPIIQNWLGLYAGHGGSQTTVTGPGTSFLERLGTYLPLADSATKWLSSLNAGQTTPPADVWTGYDYG